MMHVRAFALCAAVLAMAACTKSSEQAQPPPAPATASESLQRPPVPSQFQHKPPVAVPRPQLRELTPAEPERKPEHEGEAEVEFMGQAKSPKGVTAKQLLIYVAKAPCDVAAQEVALFGETAIPFGPDQNFFIEVFVPQGATGHVCAVALDAKRNIVASGTYEKNPLTMKGEGEVIFDKLNLELRPLKAPAPLPKGL